MGIVLQDFALGGTERIAVRLARAWAEQGVAVRIFCGADHGPLRAIAGAGPEIVSAHPALKRHIRDTRPLARAAVAHFRRRPVDAVFVPGNYHWPVAEALARLPSRLRPVIVAQISAALRKPQRTPARRILFDSRMRWLLRNTDGLVALSSVAQAEAERIVPGAVVRTIPSPALDDELPTVTPADGRIVMAAGRLVREKGFATLLEAFALLNDPDATLVIVGAGPDEARLRAKAHAFGIDRRLTLPGYQSDIRPWLDRARLFVLSSEFEGYPAVLIEALAAGRPVVATACTPANAELLTDETRGLTVPVGNADAMADAISHLLSLPAPDPHMLAASVARHQLGSVARDYLAFFEELRGDRRR